MASRPDCLNNPGCEEKQRVKERLVSSRMLLVDSLYQLGPLLDCVISEGLLSRENCYEINAERTPSNKARKLLEIVDVQFDETGACRFMECLKKCQKHYPRLRPWILSEENAPLPAAVEQGRTERHVQEHFSLLCSRLGYSVLSISYNLFSKKILTQLELEKVEAVPIQTQQAQTLLSICLKKGEHACKSFYMALCEEDLQLAEELNVNSLEDNCMQIAVEETKGHLGSTLPVLGVLQQIMTQLGLTVGEKIRFNVCEIGVALGLPHRTVRECLLEGVAIEDLAQLEALVDLYMKKTKDTDRLLSRVAELNPQRVQLSERGCLLLKLLQEAETLLRSETQHRNNLDYLRSWDNLYSAEGTGQGTVWAIFSFLLWDCMAEVLEEPEAKPSGGILEMLELLSSSGRVHVALLMEVQECWTEGDVQNLLQSVRVLSQVLRDLHPLQAGLQVSSTTEGLFSCRSRLRRVTSFHGVPARVIRKALSTVVQSFSDQDTCLLASQYFETCVRIVHLLDVVQPKQTVVSFSDATVSQHLQLVLSRSAFSAEAFDAGMRHRLLSVSEFNPVQLGLRTLMELHQETFSDLQKYLELGERHNFQFILESVQMIGSAKLLSVSWVSGPVEIDNGVEEVLRFVTSEATSFLIRLHCICYAGGRGRFKVSAPRCTSFHLLRPEEMRGTQSHEAMLFMECGGRVWLREGDGGWDELQELAQRHSSQLREEGCCFIVKGTASECEIKILLKRGRLWAVAHTHCEVL